MLGSDLESEELEPEFRASLIRRVETLEVQTRRWRIMALLLPFTATVGVLMASTAPRHAATVLEAEQYILRSPDGKVRGEFSTRVDDAPKLWLYDKTGARRVELSLLSDGLPGLRMLDGKEQIRATLGLVDEEPSLTLRDRQGQDRVTLILLANGEPSLFLRDKDGHAVWSSPSVPATE